MAVAKSPPSFRTIRAARDRAANRRTVALTACRHKVVTSHRWTHRRVTCWMGVPISEPAGGVMASINEHESTQIDRANASGKPPVPADAPPLFVLAASDDSLELAPHSVALYTDWIKAGKSPELLCSLPRETWLYSRSWNALRPRPRK